MGLIQFLVVSIVFTSQANALVEVLKPGQNKNIKGVTVVCEAKAPIEDKVFMCSCFRPDGDNVGWVEVLASEKKEAMFAAKPVCQNKFNDFTLDTIYAGCGEISW